MEHTHGHCDACWAEVQKLLVQDAIKVAALGFIRWAIPILITGTGVILAVVLT